jgi:predicted transposase YbfD/YdcC
MADYAEARAAWFATFLELPGRIPSHDTGWRVFRARDAVQFERCFQLWTDSVRQTLPAQQAALAAVVAVDGKQLRRSQDGCLGTAAVQLISAWATQSGLMLGQLHVAGCPVTTDAMNCQVATAQAIVAQEADYLLALKANQPALYNETVLLFDDLEASGGRAYSHRHAKEVSRGRGRIEIRAAWVISDTQWLKRLSSTLRWPKLTALIKLTRKRRIQTTGAVSRESRYAIASAPLAAAAITATRAHRQIANSLHWVLDTAFREDESRVCKGNGMPGPADIAENFAVLRRIALSTLKRDTTCTLGIQHRRLRAGWDPTYLLHLLQLLTQPTQTTPA